VASERRPRVEAARRGRAGAGELAVGEALRPPAGGAAGRRKAADGASRRSRDPCSRGWGRPDGGTGRLAEGECVRRSARGRDVAAGRAGARLVGVLGWALKTRSLVIRPKGRQAPVRPPMTGTLSCPSLCSTLFSILSS